MFLFFLERERSGRNHATYWKHVCMERFGIF